MQSIKAEKYIELYKQIGGRISTLNARHVVSLAEEEMKEKAIEAFCKVCNIAEYVERCCDGNCCVKEKFTNLLND